MALSIAWNETIQDRVRLLTGIEAEEIDNTSLNRLLNMAAEWFAENTGLTYSLNEENTYDNAVMYYACYLACVAQNGMGIDRIQVGDMAVYYNNESYVKFEELANQALLMKLGLSIKTTTYNASPNIGPVDWKKNVRGDDNTLRMYPKPRGVNYDG